MTKIKKGGQEWPFVTDTYYLKDTKDINIYGKGFSYFGPDLCIFGLHFKAVLNI